MRSYLRFALPLFLATLAHGQAVTISSPITVGPTDTFVSGVPLSSADITINAGGELAMNGRHTVRSITISGGSLTHSPAFSYTYAPGDLVRGMDLTVTANVSISASGIIDLRGRGEPPGRGQAPGIFQTPGGAFPRSGAGHGGLGGPGNTGGFAYGDPFAPIAFGSGGYSSIPLSPACIDSPTTPGRGGGCMRLRIGGSLIMTGSILADGKNGGSCGSSTVGAASGGSIWITCDSHLGPGTISASGGTYNSSVPLAMGGGAGGRIRIDVITASSYTGAVRAIGGAYSDQSALAAGAGTIVRTRAGAPVELQVVSASAVDSDTPLVDLDTDILLVDRASAELRGPARVDSATVTNFGVITTPVLTPLELRVEGALSLQSGSKISATGKGYPPGEGPSAGNGAYSQTNDPSGGGGGGSRGGGGNGSGGGVGGLGMFGDDYVPSAYGSGGGFARASAGSIMPGGAGGGVIHLDVGAGLILLGSIEANGTSGFSALGSQGSGCLSCGSQNRGSGAGGGGSIYVRAGSYVEPGGTANISANGGSSDDTLCAPSVRVGHGCGGGGGGGRVAVYDCSGNTPYLSARGGFAASGAGSGGSGSVIQGSGKVTISQQPAPASLRAGQAIQLAVVATSSRPTPVLGYRWRRNSQLLFDDARVSGAATPVLTIQNAACADGGDFDVIITDACGPFPSAAAHVQVRSYADFNDDGGVDGADVEAFFLTWQTGNDLADVNQDGGVDGGDVESFFLQWQAGGC